MEDITETTELERAQKTKPIFNRLLDFISSVRFGVTLLVILVVLSMTGMLIIQQNVNGFESYYASLTPAERYVYGVLGLIDIYHTWYFNGLLLVLSLNIVLSSIDRFPSAWKYISHPKKTVTKAWLTHQKDNVSLTLTDEDRIERIKRVFAENGFKPIVTSTKHRTTIFGERGKWNRLGAYIVHVFLLTLFIGHFVAFQTGFDADIQLAPKQTTSQIEIIKINLDKQERFQAKLPFTITCTDIQQTLIDPKGSIEMGNTMDWRTQIRIDDPQYGQRIADISLNKPLSYRGYRFFQSSAITVGAARKMTIEFAPENGGEVINIELDRDGETSLPDGTKIKFVQFWSDFVVGQPESDSNDYQNPAVKLKIITPGGQSFDGYAFEKTLPASAPIGKPVAGYRLRLVGYEKSPLAHVLSIKYDPYQGHFIAWYIGGFGLIFALIFVFFVAHQRIWALVDGQEVTLGGNTNRNHIAYDEKFNKIVNQLN